MGANVPCDHCSGNDPGCGFCHGLGWGWDNNAVEAAPTGPPMPFLPSFSDMVGMVKGLAIFATGLVVVCIVLIPAGWWSSVSDQLRSILEALPLGDAVAVKPSQDGNPLLIAILAGVAVAAAILATTRWRLRSVREYLFGGNTWVQPFVVSLIRTVTIFGGITLIPILAIIASGKDLRDEPAYTFTGPAWPLIIIACWLAYSWVGFGRVHDREAGKPPKSGS